METMSTEEKQEIIDTLYGKGANLPCHRCNGKEFSLSTGYFVQNIHSHEIINEISGFIGSTNYLPSALIICENCGNINQHSLGILGLLRT